MATSSTKEARQMLLKLLQAQKDFSCFLIAASDKLRVEIIRSEINNLPKPNA